MSGWAGDTTVAAALRGASGTAALAALYESLSDVHVGLQLEPTLERIVTCVVENLGFQVAVVHVTRDDGLLVAAAVAGDDDAKRVLTESSVPLEMWQRQIDQSRPDGPGGTVRWLEPDKLDEWRADGHVVWQPAPRDLPPVPAQGRRVWHQHDGLYVPLQSPSHGLIGVLSVDVPDDGLVPTQDQLGLLEMFAVVAAMAIEQARLHADVVRTREEAARALLEHRDTHDGLTDLPNWVLIAGEIDRLLRSGEPVAVIALNLTAFREVNAVLGHSAGDRLLVSMGPRISPVLPATATLGRLAGDEFIVLLPGVDRPQQAQRVAEDVRAAVQVPFELDGLSVDLEVACGVVLAPQDGDSAASVLRRVETATSVARRSGSGIAFYDPQSDVRPRHQLGLAGQIRRGLSAGELRPHFQPQVDLRTGEICGAEALVRWYHPTRGVLPPAAFLDVVEAGDLIHPLTRSVLDQALAAAAGWHATDPGVSVAVNVSTRCLQDRQLVPDVLAALERHGVPAQRLTLEITESALMAERPRILAALTNLTDQGVRLSLDDFGTGYSSLSHLRALPVSELKVDRTFVRDMTGRPTDARLVRTVVDLAHSLGMLVVAEGVEDAATLAALADMGCDVAQGFFYAPAMPQDAWQAWCQDRSAVGELRPDDLAGGRA